MEIDKKEFNPVEAISLNNSIQSKNDLNKYRRYIYLINFFDVSEIDLIPAGLERYAKKSAQKLRETYEGNEYKKHLLDMIQEIVDAETKFSKTQFARISSIWKTEFFQQKLIGTVKNINFPVSPEKLEQIREYFLNVHWLCSPDNMEEAIACVEKYIKNIQKISFEKDLSLEQESLEQYMQRFILGRSITNAHNNISVNNTLKSASEERWKHCCYNVVL